MGDSISQGREGDHTWRYRLSRSLARHGVPARFAGPWRGTWVPSAAQPPGGRPAPPGHPAYAGPYREGLRFPDSRHYACWGRRLDEAKDNIADAVAEHRPDWLMVALGFNDLAWGVCGPDRLLAAMDAFVHQARRAAPEIGLLVADVVHRTPLEEHPHLERDVAAYNRRLPALLRGSSTARSPVAQVGLGVVYDARTDSYDGVHPNELGEIKIARAFAEVFLGTAAIRRPAPVPG
ncbi:GDSL-type esterase/lipase family protein [Sphaerisporangium siamense]|uniref:SGNH hydrolase-type esterase domain-containing protein n=1 Tax=Sphaerisporangium siamense TaxID=795645 RepID=A0A7W7D912_9ACTN|nr:GDSL-type esterase/lipase family protein [Sphaerisporangium siamense]MBB4702482.1 hypothetical protein [Sphaerisporangium siamense]